MNYIKHIYETATDSEKNEGLLWYPEAFRTASVLASEFDTDIKATVWALACLSPNNKWDSNILGLVSVLNAFRHKNYGEMMANFESKVKGAFQSLYCRTYPLNIYKAFKCLEGNLEYLKGRKVTSFADNIFYPDSEKVTIDGHAYSIYIGKKLTMSQASPHIQKEYSIVEQAYINTALELELKPYQLQAITWVSWRNRT